MVFVSLISPLLRRCGLQIICVGLASTSSFGESRFFKVSHTPYDRQMIRVNSILASTNGEGPSRVSPSVVSQWMSELRAVPYSHSRRWQRPSEINMMGGADCKDKAVALYAQMRRNGARNLRIVIGKHHIQDSSTHAWVEWEAMGGSYVLDPTFEETPVTKMELSPMKYVPYYAYDGEHKYRAVNTGLVASTARETTDYGKSLYVSANAASLAHSGRVSVGPARSFPARTRYAALNPQYRQPYFQYPRSDGWRSSPNVAGLHRLGSTTAKPHARTRTQASATSIKKRLAPNVRRSLPHAVGIRQPRSFDQYPPPVIRMQPAPLTTESEL